jgi:hypothetical protein
MKLKVLFLFYLSLHLFQSCETKSPSEAPTEKPVKPDKVLSEWVRSDFTVQILAIHVDFFESPEYFNPLIRCLSKTTGRTYEIKQINAALDYCDYYKDLKYSMINRSDKKLELFISVCEKKPVRIVASSAGFEVCDAELP